VAAVAVQVVRILNAVLVLPAMAVMEEQEDQVVPAIQVQKFVQALVLPRD
jgi:hypothetical protein